MKYSPDFTRLSNSELRKRNAIYQDLGEGEKCAEDGNVVMANIIYNSNRHKIGKMDFNDDLKAALRRLKTAIDAEYDRQREISQCEKEFKVEEIKIPLWEGVEQK